MTNTKRVLLTGGSGMVGCNIQEQLADSCWQIFAPGRSELDLIDETAVLNYFATTKPDIVIHSAGLVGGIHTNMANPVAFMDVNMTIGRNVIMGAYKTNVPRLINLASTCVYPRNAPNPLTEEMILTGEFEPTNEGYAIAKIMALRLCQYINAESREQRFKTVIPCNLYGRHDKFKPQYSHLVPAIIDKVHHAKINCEPTVEIWGNGTARREFMYAGDLAGALIRAVDQFDSLPELMNLGPGYDCSVNDYYISVAEVVGWQGEFVHNLSKPVGMQQKLASEAKQIQWGWRPNTTLIDGIRKTYDFYLENLQQ